MYDLSSISIETIKGVGKVKKGLLNKLGIESVYDLLFYFPKRYEDRSNLKKFKDLIPGTVETTEGKIISSEILRPRPRLNILKVMLYDGSNYITAIWFNQGKYIENRFKTGKEIVVTGKVNNKFGKLEIAAYDYDFTDKGKQLNTGGVVPFYPSTQGLHQRFLRDIIKNSLDKYSDFLLEVIPEKFITPLKIPSMQWCIKKMHFPNNLSEQEIARKYLAFREFAFFQFGVLVRKKVISKNQNFINNIDVAKKYLLGLPFKLTDAQERVWGEIQKDLKSTKRMARLLQGDVGCGKTVIAVLSLISCCSSGYQGALMAPTEILARQHYLDISEDLKALNIRTCLLTGNISQTERKELLKKISAGQIDLVIGTHAIIQEKVIFHKLGLIVIDEQHKFGVNQRLKIAEKGNNPNILVMTATPIPRTLALTLYGDLDISVIDQKPVNRGNVITKFISENNRKRLYAFISKELELGRQAYVICPLVEESEKLDLENAVTMKRILTKQFSRYSVKLVHGKMPSKEKENVMTEFRKGDLNILVSTTVVEVGVNIPNANIMLIENVERFGLSQLHQLRGRISRSSNESYCFLLGNIKNDDSKYRVKAMCTTNDGFKIAEIDLKLRGPGEMFGTKQHGMPEFKTADIINDAKILDTSIKYVKDFIDKNSEVADELYNKNTKFMNIDFSKIFA